MLNAAHFPGIRARRQGKKSSGETNTPLRLLAITTDEPFYSCLHGTATSCGWEIVHAGTVKQALETLSFRSLPLVVYDGEILRDDWQYAMDRLSAHPSKPCVLLACRIFDEYLLRDVTRHGGFQVLLKSAGWDQRIRDLRFAWFWRTHGQTD